MLTLVTATGARPEAWRLCERWMLRQTYADPVRWVIVDDGPEPQPITFRRAGWELVLIRPAPFWQPGQNTQARNLAKGMEAVGRDDVAVFAEDDDHYSPGWLDAVAQNIDRADLIGTPHARYYNLPARIARQLNNGRHASLCSSAIRGSAIDEMRRILKRADKFIDMQLWQRVRSRHLFAGQHVTGIKGLPGRGGIGMGHSPEFKGTPDPDLRILREWIGEDAEAYL
jgi:hypothetical protein